jgi:hypothetical protein
MKQALRLRLVSSPELNYSQAEKDLKLWGRFLRPLMYSKDAYYNRQAQCILPKIMMFGKKKDQPSGYYETPEPIDHYAITQVHRLFHFLPSDELKAAVIQRFIYDGEERFKALRLGLTQHTYRRQVEKAVNFFVLNRNVDFS